MRNKKEGSTHIDIKVELQDLRKKNHQLQNDLRLKTVDLEKEKRQKQAYIKKYHQLEKEKAESVKRYQDLLMLLIKNNIDYDQNPFTALLNQSPNKNTSLSGPQTSKRIKNNISNQKQEINQQQSFLTKALQQSVQSIKQKQRSLQKARKKLSQFSTSSSKLITLKQINGGSFEFRQVEQRKSDEPRRQDSNKRLSYLQKLKTDKY